MSDTIIGPDQTEQEILLTYEVSDEALETAAGGLFFGGHGVASFDLPLSVAPERERPFYIAAVAVAGGAAFAVTSALGGAFADLASVQAPLRTVAASRLSATRQRGGIAGMGMP